MKEDPLQNAVLLEVVKHAYCGKPIALVKLASGELRYVSYAEWLTRNDKYHHAQSQPHNFVNPDTPLLPTGGTAAPDDTPPSNTTIAPSTSITTSVSKATSTSLETSATPSLVSSTSSSAEKLALCNAAVACC